mmetsp:Transcript_123814/g.283920  ORF Transcript_123814/g.283920 Transcript_123814/m.283920 type:complete len:473 (-) Transcript_123814:8-1426(-)
MRFLAGVAWGCASAQGVSSDGFATTSIQKGDVVLRVKRGAYLYHASVTNSSWAPLSKEDKTVLAVATLINHRSSRGKIAKYFSRLRESVRAESTVFWTPVQLGQLAGTPAARTTARERRRVVALSRSTGLSADILRAAVAAIRARRVRVAGREGGPFDALVPELENITLASSGSLRIRETESGLEVWASRPHSAGDVLAVEALWKDAADDLLAGIPALDQSHRIPMQLSDDIWRAVHDESDLAVAVTNTSVDVGQSVALAIAGDHRATTEVWRELQVQSFLAAECSAYARDLALPLPNLKGKRATKARRYRDSARLAFTQCAARTAESLAEIREVIKADGLGDSSDVDVELKAAHRRVMMVHGATSRGPGMVSVQLSQSAREVGVDPDLVTSLINSKLFELSTFFHTLVAASNVDFRTVETVVQAFVRLKMGTPPADLSSFLWLNDLSASEAVTAASYLLEELGPLVADVEV